jgi:hypothetical protein
MAVNPQEIEELNAWWESSNMADLFRGDPWKLFTKLRSKTCATCDHAFEHHGVGDNKTVCWVSGCGCETVTWT